MRAFNRVLLPALCVGVLGAGCALADEAALQRSRELEKSGDAMGARAVLRKAALDSRHDVRSLLAYAEFLDRYRDAEARTRYASLIPMLNKPEMHGKLNAVTRRLLTLDMLAGDRDAAKQHYEAYKKAGGTELTLANFESKPAVQQVTIDIPGPLRSFARMAALSPDLEPADLLPALARNIVTNGYQASSGNESLEPTEYLKLVIRYLSQARELNKLAGDRRMIAIESCESEQAGELLKVLGYRMRGGCGSEVVLETVNATRAFLTIDSGFPLADLEQALRTNQPFRYDYKPASVPVIFDVDYWASLRNKEGGDFIDAFINDPSMCRLYLGLSKLDPETAAEMRKAIPPPRLKAFAHVLDFYGGMFQIRNGEALVPGGAKGVALWKDLTGKSPSEGAAFYERLMIRDDGWLASLYDAMGRIDGPTREYLLDSKRMLRFYTALRGRITSPGPARPVFRSNTDMMLLTQRLRIEPDGKPHIPGNLEIWRNFFINHPHGKYDGKLTRLATTWKEPDDLIEALFALSRKSVENEPLKIYMALTDLNRFRAKPLEPTTVDRLAREYRSLGAQYSIFSESPTLSDKTILQYLDTAQRIGQMRDQLSKAENAGMLQSLTGLWQIFVRQGSLANEQADEALSAILNAFSKPLNNRELFDAGSEGVKTLLKATNSPEKGNPQERMLDLLAGRSSNDDSGARRQLIQSMSQIFEAQRLVSLSTIFDMANHLEALTKGEKPNTVLLNRLASRIAEINLPRASLSTVEKNAMAFGYYTEKHIDAERRVNLRAAIEKSLSDPEKLRELRGQLTPFLRDTLVGFNYIHYAPPGAQVLMTNPLFVRSHDFLGLQGTNQTWRTTEVFGSGWPSNAGGRLVGSLSGLPYALAEAEQNFLIPSREQALIWGDLVPQMIIAAKVPRWWNVTPAQLHWVGLHMAQGESLLAESAFDAKQRTEVIELLNRHAPPARVRKVEYLIAQGDVRDAVEHVTPSEMFALAKDWWKAYPNDGGLYAVEARRLQSESPDQVNYTSCSRAFGTPKPTLANSYRPELLQIRTFPTLMGYSSRIMAESWESNLLYYAALADELHMSPSRLNILVPEWTQATVEKIFATHLEDWPALLRSLRLVGNDVRSKMRQQLAAERNAALD
jgi:hypothetical protein